MINLLHKKEPRKLHLGISENSTGFEIQVGSIASPSSFIVDQTILISNRNPNVLWDLLHNLIGIPYPQLEPKEPEPVEEKIETQIEEKEEITGTDPEGANFDQIDTGMDEKLSFEQELQQMSALEIVKKVEEEKGVLIKCSLKSKKNIIKKALKIYSD